MDTTRLILSLVLLVFGLAELIAAIFSVRLPGFASVLMGLFLMGWGVKTLLELRREKKRARNTEYQPFF